VNLDSLQPYCNLSALDGEEMEKIHAAIMKKPLCLMEGGP